MPTSWITLTLLNTFRVFFSVPSNSSTSPETKRSGRQCEGSADACMGGGSFTGEVPQVADEQGVGPREGDGLGLFHRAHGQFCVCCKTDTTELHPFHPNLSGRPRIPKTRLTGKVRRVEDVVVEVLLHQDARHPLTLNTLIISQRPHHLRGDETIRNEAIAKNHSRKQLKPKKEQIKTVGFLMTLASFSPLKLRVTASVLRGLWTSM